MASLIDEIKGRHIKLFNFFIEIIFALIIIIFSLIKGFNKDIGENLILSIT